MQQILTTIATWLVVTALLNLAAHRSQVDAWCERRPRLAAVLKVLRGIGLDPWLLVQGVTLALRGRLPVGLRPPPVDDVPVTVENAATEPSPTTLKSGLVFLVLFAAACSSAPPKCPDELDLASLEAAYVAQVLAECPPAQYAAPEACPRYAALQADYRARRQAWVECS